MKCDIITGPTNQRLVAPYPANLAVLREVHLETISIQEQAIRIARRKARCLPTVGNDRINGSPLLVDFGSGRG
jgi:hypothetical protein